MPNDFVFDDAPIVASNPVIRSISPIQFLKSPYWTKQQYEGIYRPFTIFSLSVDYAIWKKWAPGFRITNLVLHAVNGFLVFLLCTSLVGEGLVPLAAMLIYLVHPVHTEAVTSLVGRSELFATCFFMIAWLLFRRGRTWWAAGAFALALLSKENAIVLPAILLLDWWFLATEWRQSVAPGVSPGITASNEMSAGGAEDSSESVAPTGLITPDETSTPGSRPGLCSFATAWLVIVGVAGAYLALRYSVLGGLGIPKSAQYMGGQLTYFERLLTSGRVFIQYFRLVLFPVNVAGDYDYNAVPIAKLKDWDAWLGLFLVAAIIAAAFWKRRKYWVLSFGLIFAFIVISPSSNWVMPISVLMAERFLYLPLVGLSIAAGAMFAELEDQRIRKLIAIGGLLAAVVLCNGHDYIRRNDFTFFANMVRIEPNSAKAHLGYGYALFGKGRMEEAAQQFQAGLRIIPDHPELLVTLAMTKMTSRSCSAAWPILRRALQIDPRHADAHRRMGDCYLKEGKPSEAEAMYREAVQSIPYPDSMLYFMWGQTLEDTGQKVAAIDAYEKAVLIDPNNTFIKERLTALKTQ